LQLFGVLITFAAASTSAGVTILIPDGSGSEGMRQVQLCTFRGCDGNGFHRLVLHFPTIVPKYVVIVVVILLNRKRRFEETNSVEACMWMDRP
jgi:hypothetical protein